MRLGRLASGVAALFAAGCSVGGAPDGVIDDCAQQVALPPGVSTDILFVIDDSVSMREEQEKVARELEGFVSTLAEGPIANDFRIGVVTTGVSEHVALGCEADAATELRRRPDESGRLQPATLPGDTGAGKTILSWDDPDLIERFAALVRRGTAGGGQEMGLEAMRLALTEPLASAQGFLRPGARLLVVVVSDEDDCSDPSGTAVSLVSQDCATDPCDTDAQCAGDGTYCLAKPDGTPACIPNACESAEGRAGLEPVERYVELLQNLDDGTGRGRKREAYLAVIGSIDPASGEPARCSSSTDDASGIGTRYAAAVEAMGERGTIASICADDYGAALTGIAELVQAPQVLELAQSPVDGRMVQVELERADGSEVVCRSGAGFSFEAAGGGLPARVTLEDECRLQHGDKIDVKLICAG
jgi:hypothetical protein